MVNTVKQELECKSICRELFDDVKCRLSYVGQFGFFFMEVLKLVMKLLMRMKVVISLTPNEYNILNHRTLIEGILKKRVKRFKLIKFYGIYLFQNYSHFSEKKKGRVI